MASGFRTVSVRLWICLRLSSEACTWNWYVPSVVGVPLMRPFDGVSPHPAGAGLRRRPCQRRRARRLSCPGSLTSAAWSGAEYGTPTLAFCGTSS